MAVYPTTLPQAPLIRGFRDERGSGTVRSNMDTGLAKTRKRFTTVPRKITWPTILNGTQRLTFDTFFITTINEGNASFTIPDPVDDATITVKFFKPPAWSIINAKSTLAGDRLWSASYGLEVLP
jgi:hypothetical protein